MYKIVIKDTKNMKHLFNLLLYNTWMYLIASFEIPERSFRWLINYVRFNWAVSIKTGAC